ncbi:hypothetical protein I6A60_11445 [Frankia sp. AgB1.9]|uniref:hypothetical protein n=1 Tax=unclassified Frankia TaxID=2632575 RepID=UPI001931E9C1|nr:MULTISPECIES: hypothetical protein [unclassified Frankia]MBL7489310.1 hypothetical protein [Frankia sp. AgW1.1]MBL7548481.1 hypothetical protein [Frankia sp. AgB1.9]MBL7623076.1 hypothetical protein [Frankia sp. AgB1.8]
MNSRNRLGRSVLLTGGLLLLVPGCRAGAAAVSTADAAPATAPAAVAGSSAPVGAGTGGAGSLTLGITSPIAVAGHVDTAVSCQIAGRRYAESATGSVGGSTVAESVRVASYTGPGSYSALVTVSLVGPDAARYAVDAVPATVMITSTGGSVSFSASTSAGRTLAGSISWACS